MFWAFRSRGLCAALTFPCPSRKSALDKMWMNDRLCPSVTSFMKRAEAQVWSSACGFSCLCWKSFSCLSWSGVRLLIRNTSFPHICVQCSVKEVLDVKLKVAIFPLESSVFPGGCIGLCKRTVVFKLSPDNFNIL